MSKIILKIIKPLKKLRLKGRLTIALLSIVFIIWAGSDILFNLKNEQLKEFTINELYALDKEEIPTYFRIKGQLRISNRHVDTGKDYNSDKTKIYYLIYESETDSTLEDLLDQEFNLRHKELLQKSVNKDYGVFKKDTTDVYKTIIVVEKNLKIQTIDSILNIYKLGISYIDGKYLKYEDLPLEIWSIFTEENLQIPEESIVLGKGELSLSFLSASLMLLVFTVLLILMVLSFIPIVFLIKLFDRETYEKLLKIEKALSKGAQKVKTSNEPINNLWDNIMIKRAAAYLIDIFIVISLIFSLNKLTPFLPPIFIIIIPYFVISEAYMNGSSFGKKMIGIQTVPLDPSLNSKSRILIRNLLKGALFLFPLLFLFILFNEKNETLYDLIMKTTVKKTKDENKDWFIERINYFIVQSSN